MARFRIETPWLKWPLDEPIAAIGANTYYPMELNLEQASRYYYRCRHWNLSWTLSSGDWAGTYSYGIDAGIGLSNLTTETELVFNGAQTAVGWPEPSHWKVTGSLGPSGGGISMVWELTFMDQGLAQVDDKYYPFFYLQINPGDTEAIVTKDGLLFAGNVDFDSIKSIPFYSATGTSAFSNVRIQPVATYWEYRDKDGENPIYNSTTGDVLPGMEVFHNAPALEDA